MKSSIFLVLICFVTSYGFKKPVKTGELSLLLVSGRGTVYATADQVEFEYAISASCTVADSMRHQISEHLHVIQDSLDRFPFGKIQLRLGKLLVTAQERHGTRINYVSKQVNIAVLDTSYMEVVTALMDQHDFVMNSQYWKSKEEDKICEQAYKDACADAKSKAKILANELSVEIVGVHRIYTDGLGRKETGYEYGRPKIHTPGFRAGADGHRIFDLSKASASSVGGASRISVQEITYITELTVEFLIK